MSKIPFKRFIITFLLFNKDIRFIIDKLKIFGYCIKEDEIKDVFDDIRYLLPKSLTDLLDAKIPFDLSDSVQVQWLKELGVFEYYDYIMRKSSVKEDETPEYFKWCEDCLWIHSYKDVMSITNILMFNEEPFDEISKILLFKYKKKVGIDALNLYKKVFWDTDCLTAKEALYHCEPFRNNALIIRKLRSGNTEVTSFDGESDNGSDVPFTFHDSGYIKWKIGYHDIKIPSARDFVDRIKKDAYYHYIETMSMIQSIESEEETGMSDQFGASESKKIIRKNVEEQRVKQAKGWMDIYLKANDAVPEDGENDGDFFKKMADLKLDFESDEKISFMTEIPGLIEDIKGDI